MNKAIKKKWLKALRSGKYTQGFNQLRVGGDQYCCLGVLEEIEAGRIHNATANQPSRACLKRCGLDPDSQLIDDLAFKNDKLMWSFKQIADWIEKNL